MAKYVVVDVGLVSEDGDGLHRRQLGERGHGPRLACVQVEDEAEPQLIIPADDLGVREREAVQVPLFRARKVKLGRGRRSVSISVVFDGGGGGGVSR